MQLTKTALQIKEDLKRALAHKKAKKIILRTHHLGEPLDNLTRDDFYPDPKS